MCVCDMNVRYTRAAAALPTHHRVTKGQVCYWDFTLVDDRNRNHYSLFDGKRAPVFFKSESSSSYSPRVSRWAWVLAPRLTLKCSSGNMTLIPPPVDGLLISIWLFMSHRMETVLLLALSSTVGSKVAANLSNISCLPEWGHVLLYSNAYKIL